MENKYILSKNITNTIDKYFFTHFFIAKEEKNVIEKIVSSI